jgi:tetratricopeptide (TPR) repeat protein
MKEYLALLLLLFASAGGLNRVAEINTHTANARQAMDTGNYREAVRSYEMLLDSLQVKDDRARLNLAHAYFKNDQKDKAYKTYSLLLKKNNRYLQSVSALQLGILSAEFKDYPEALRFYRQALIIDPGNEAARYNYELLKKYLKDNPEEANQEKQIPPPRDQQQKDQQKEKATKKEDDKGQEEQETDTDQPDDNKQQDQQQQPDQQGSQPQAPSASPGHNQHGRSSQTPEASRQQEQLQGSEPGTETGTGSSGKPENKAAGQNNKESSQVSDREEHVQTRYERLKQMNISPEKANMILDAMRESEQQYIQQLPRKGTAKQDRSKPDW